MPVVGLAKRWTFYIGKDGKILFVDKAVKVDTAGADIAAKLAELVFGEKTRWTYPGLTVVFTYNKVTDVQF